jgi:hypothetical protein
MHNNTPTSLSVLNQIPEFIQESNPLFQKFMESYYKSQEKVGAPLNIVNNLTSYMDIDSYDLVKINGTTELIEDIDLDATNIKVENVDGFLDKDGTILVNDEIIYYESITKSPSVTLSPAISYSEFNRKKIFLLNLFDQFDGEKKSFKLISNNEPVFPVSSKHLLVKLYGQTLIPDVDYQILNDNIIFANAPRQFDPLVFGDDSSEISFEYLKGFETTTIITANVSRLDSNKFKLSSNNLPLKITSDVLLLVILNNNLLKAYEDYSVFDDTLILKNDVDAIPYVYFINFNTTSVGQGCLSYSLVNARGQVESIVVKNTGKNYSINNTPKVTIDGAGKFATAKALVNGIKSVNLLDGGSGYSIANPPLVKFQEPQNISGSTPIANVVVDADGSIKDFILLNSGSGYDSPPRIQFINPSGAEVKDVVVNPDTGQIMGVSVISPGFGYSNPPKIYIDPPVEENGITASLIGILNDDGELHSVEIRNPGKGYSASNPPRVKVIQPTGAQVLDIVVDNFGRVISIELLSGGKGYKNIPSVYIVDDRKDNQGNPIGGVGAAAVASVFNEEIVNINIIEFGTGYSAEEPPKVFISEPDSAKASSTIGFGEITGIEIVNPGINYSTSQFIGCSRGVSGIVGYTEDNKAIFVSENESKPKYHPKNSEIKSLDSVFFSKVIDRISKQYLPGLPTIPLENINISNILKTAKDFYASKGTQLALKYLFNVLYGVSIDISYPKDQIIKPSAANWSVDTIMRAKLIRGNAINLSNGLMEQMEDLIDDNVKYARALIENYIAIQTPKYDVYELTISDESIQGQFVIPYKTKLSEKLNKNDIIITVDSTIGWPERNGEVVVGNEIIRYREKSLTQFIECTRGVNGFSEEWESGTECSSNFNIYVNKDTPQEVVLSILGIVEANKTKLSDSGKYYLPGDKLNISKLGSTEDLRLLDSWLFNVKKLLKIEQITFGGQNNQTATVICENPHGLLIGDQFTVYGANPIIYNGTFLVTSIPTKLSFTYELPQPAVLNPQGNIIISIDLNKGKSDFQSINNAINNFATNIQNAFFDDSYVYVASSGIPNYKIGPFVGTALLPGNQRKLNRFPKIPATISIKQPTQPGSIGTFVNGISAWNYKSQEKLKFGPLTNIKILKSGSDYDAVNPPSLIIEDPLRQASGKVEVNGSIVDIEVLNGGSNYTSSPLVSISGGGGQGASASAIITNGSVSRILISNSGSGFTSNPVINIIGGGGSGAAARAIVRGPIKSIELTNPGQNFTIPPKVTLNSGSGAAAEAFISNGRIISISVIASGSGYTTEPNVIITGDGFGAVAKAAISTEGADSGRVVEIKILNRGIGYKQGTTKIRLESIGSGAVFQSEILQWTFNLNETVTFDSTNGSIFEGYNKQFGGEYGNISNPKQLRFVLGDNLTVVNDNIIEKQSGLTHSPIIGWAFDGNPIYGPYGYTDPTNVNSGISLVRSSYRLKPNLVSDPTLNPNPFRINGPDIQEYPAGIFIEDYEYVFNSEAIFLDEYNGRFSKTPEFPNGIYAYYITLNTNGSAQFPYVIGDRYYSQPDAWNLNQFAIQSNIPKGIVRYRDPFENVDIEGNRQIDDITNILTLEDGNFLVYDVQDLNNDGFITDDEINLDVFILEENKLEVFDYFPKIDISSKVDIEVETTTRFEDAKISEFLIENAGINYQVGDRLLFDNTGTEGSGVSASVFSIAGENIVNYSYNYNENKNIFEGIITTENQHNLNVGDIVEVKTIPQMEPVSKTFKIITVSGLESAVVLENGIGYSDDTIDVNLEIETVSGSNAVVIPTITSTGIFNDVKILNSGFLFEETPRIRVSHPQISSRANYFALSVFSTGEEVKILNSLVLPNKEFYLVGSIRTQDQDTHGFVSKFNSEGLLIWKKTISAVQPQQEIKYCELNSIVKDGNSIYISGSIRPNSLLSNSFNPNIILVKLTDGATPTINWQRQYSGISGSSRQDYSTDISIYNGNVLVSGYTTTNSNHTNDAFVMYIAANGDTLARRKITSPSTEDKFLQVKVNSKNEIYLLGTSSNRIYIANITITGNRIEAKTTKVINSNNKSFNNLSLNIDEYDDLYITGAQKNIASNQTNKFFIIRLDSNQNIKWSNSYNIPEAQFLSVSKSSIDIFGEINVSCSVLEENGQKYVISTKINYKGDVIKSNKLVSNNYGYEASACISDVSGDPILFGNYYDNNTKFLFDGSTFADKSNNISDLQIQGTVSISSDSKYGDSSYEIETSGRLRAVTSVDPNSWTLEGWFKYDSIPTTKLITLVTVTDGSDAISIQIDGRSSIPATYGKIRTSINETHASWSSLSNVLSLTDSNYAHIRLTKTIFNDISTYKIYVNGVLYSTQTSNVNIDPKQIDIGNTSSAISDKVKVDDIRLSDYEIISSTIPTTELLPYNYRFAKSYALKLDKNSDTNRLGTLQFSNYSLERSIYEITSENIECQVSNYNLAAAGFQVLDYSDITIFLQQDSQNITPISQIWSSRSATIPSPGGKKPILLADSYDKFYFRVFNTSRVDNIRAFTINQDFIFNANTTLTQFNAIGIPVASAKIIEVDLTNNLIYVSLVNGTFSLNFGQLESSDNIQNQINDFVFPNQDAISPGSFTIQIPNEVDAVFKDYSPQDYQVRIDEIIPGSPYTRGSVISLSEQFFSFSPNKKELSIDGLSSVTQITLISNLKKVLYIENISNTDEIFVFSQTSHYLNTNDIIFIQSSPEYSETNGTYFVDRVFNKKSFTFKLQKTPSSFIEPQNSFDIYVKHPILKLIYGQQYSFDMSDASNEGHFLSFYRDNLNRIEYTFQNVTRQGIPGINQVGNSPFITFKVTDDVSNITYYNDPSKPIGRKPIGSNSYIDILNSPYIGSFEITNLSGATITTGSNQFIFPLKFEPEKSAISSFSSYSTTSSSAVGSISKIRLISGGGFYKKLPIITGFESIRKIERVEIIDPGTEYQPGEYFGVPISGNGNGGKVRIRVDGTTDPAGQIVEVVVTDPGKGYTRAFIDIDSIPGILGPQLTGSGAVLNVIIPPRGSGASIFVKGSNVGKIKKLKNNNFGFDYTHDYTLRPEITFPVNLQLVGTSVLNNIKVIDPGTGYNSPPEVIITGGGGSGATAEAILRNGRINGIIIKNSGSGYTSPPNIELKSSFNYAVNLDLQLFQFPVPHGIINGAEIKFDVIDIGEGANFPLTSFGFLNRNQTYYAISGITSGLEPDQLRIALTPGDAISGNFISFVNAGNGKQIILTDSFGGKAEAVLETARFLSGETVYQGLSLDNSNAIGTVSINEGWQIGPRLLKLVDYTGQFKIGERVNGLISRASGIISDISIARGVLEVDSITTTPGKFIDDTGKLSEIVQRVQDSYLYQSFSYNIKSPISIDEWKNIVIDNVHPAGFKIFGEIGITGGEKGASNKTDFELVKGVNLIENSVVSHIDNFALGEPIYSDFDNTQILFRNKRLTSSEEILTSFVQKIDNISNLFDGERTVFPLTIDGSPVVAQTSQFMISLNGIVQSPGTSFNVQQGTIIFSEPPSAPTQISYAVAELQYEQTQYIELFNVSGIIPEIGVGIRGLTSNATAVVVSSTSNTLIVFDVQGVFLQGEVIISALTGLNANISSIETVESNNIYRFKEKITNLRKNTAIVEEINLDVTNNIIKNTIVISKTSGTYDSPSGLLDIKVGDYIVSAETGIVSKVISLTPYTDPNTYIVINSSYEFEGDFQPGEIVSGLSSSSTGVVIFWNPEIKRLILKTLTGSFVPNEIIVGQSSNANHKILTTIKIDPVSSISISDASTFYGLLFNRVINPLNPNTIVDDISRSLIEVVDITDNTTKVESNFAEFDTVENVLIDYTNTTGSFQENEFIQNILVNYTNNSGQYEVDELVEIRKLTYHSISGGNFQLGDSIIGLSSNAEASVIGINYALKTIYIGYKDGDFIAGETISCSDVTAIVSTYFAIPFDVKQIKSSTNTLVTDQIYTDSQHRFRDAANLLRLNSTYIIEEAAGRLKNRYPNLLIPGDSFNSNSGTNRCKLDLSLLLQAVIKDLENGGNYESITAARFYLDENGGLRFIQRQVLQSVYAHTQMNILCQQAINGQLSKTPQYTNVSPVPPINITIDNNDCANVVSQIDTLWNSINDIIAPTGNVYRDAANLIWFNKEYIAEECIAYIDQQFTFILNGIQYKAFQYPGGSSETCKRDIIEYILPSIVSDLVSGGDVNIINAIKSYITTTNNIQYVKDELLPTVVALEKARELCQYAVNNWILPDSSEYQSIFNILIPKYKDLSITLDDGTYGGGCADIKSNIDVLFQKAIDTLIPVSQVNKDAAKLVLFNKEYIKIESLQRMLDNFPGFQVPGGNAKCLRDIGYIVDAIVYDLLTGGNSAIYNATLVYIDQETGTISSLEGELIQSIYAYQQVRDLIKQSIEEILPNPAPASGFIPYVDSSISITGSNLLELKSFVDSNMQILLGTLNNPNYIEINDIEPFNLIEIPAIAYSIREAITPVKGGIASGDYMYGTISNSTSEIVKININRSKIKTLLKKIRIDFTDNLQKYSINDILTVSGQPSKTCRVYSTYYSENINFIDVQVISGTISINDVLINDVNYSGSVVSVVDRAQLINNIGSFDNGDYIRAPKSNTTSYISLYSSISSPILSNRGGNITLDTQTMLNKFHESNVIYSNNSEIFLDLIDSQGSDLKIGNIILSTEIYRLRINIPDSTLNTFIVGQQIKNIPGSKNATLINIEEIQGSTYLYVCNVNGGMFSENETIVYIDGSDEVVGSASIQEVLIINSEAFGFISRLISIGNTVRVYLNNVVGVFEQYAQIISEDFKAGISAVSEVSGRVTRSFRGFDGAQTTFKLTYDNGIPYFPDSDGHVLVFINGILQPVGVSYTTFSDIIQFNQPPELGASFHAAYIGKLRRLDDLSFDFDSLRNSFNLRLNEIFYSLTITDGVQSTTIKPENNIIISLNGVVQEPGVAFELVGSRLIFSQTPRAGSTFVAYSYIGSDIDVIASTVVPPIEPGDQLLIESEDKDRTVAVVESSNSLTTFDYQGSIFGRNAVAIANLISGRIESVQLTSGGDGYTSPPTVSISSPTGFDAQIRAQVGISRVDVVDGGSNYKYPEIDVVTEVAGLEDTTTFDSSSATFDLSFVTFDAS